jgi:hypothetical protein
MNSVASASTSACSIGAEQPAHELAVVGAAHHLDNLDQDNWSRAIA